MKLNFCIDCKYFKEQDATCEHPDSAIVVDYVFGKSSFTVAKEMREDESKCGREGRFFCAIRHKFLKVDFQ